MSKPRQRLRPSDLPQTKRALVRLLWIFVADDAECTCCLNDRCALCEAMVALNFGVWVNAKDAAICLRAEERALGVRP